MRRVLQPYHFLATCWHSYRGRGGGTGKRLDVGGRGRCRGRGCTLPRGRGGGTSKREAQVDAGADVAHCKVGRMHVIQ